MWIVKLFIEVLFGFASSWGFGIITRIPKRILLPAGITGALSWGSYCMFGMYSHQIIWQNLIATIVIGFLGNIFAYLYKTPVTMIYIPSLVSLVPGGMAAISMKSVAMGNQKQAGSQLFNVFLVALALAVGLIVGEVLLKMIRRIFTYNK